MPAKTAFKQAIVAATVLGLVTVAFFWQLFFKPNTWMPAGGGDLVPFLYPNFHFAAEQLKQGIIPLWNPHLYSGAPFAADPQSGLFYPINLLVLLIAPQITVQTLQYLAIFHFWLAGFGMFLFLQHSPLAKAHQISPLIALAGAIIFEFSDLFIVHFGNLNMIAVAAWLPLVMLLFQWAIVKKRLRAALGAGAVLAVATLASHIQITLFILLALGLYAGWHIVMPTQPIRQRWLQRLMPLKMLLITLLITVGLSSLWLIPTLEMSQHTLRTDLTYQEATAFSLNPPQLIGLLIPTYFGRDPALHWGPWDRVETGYVGILPLLLALFAVLFKKDNETRFFLFLTAIAFLLALGQNSILHSWLSLSPGFGQFRAPARYILLMDFGLATLATVGLARFAQAITAAEKPTLTKTLKWLTLSSAGLLIVSLPLAYYALLISQDRNPEIFRRVTAATDGLTTFALLLVASLILLHLAQRKWLQGRPLVLTATALIIFDLFSLGANVDVGYADPTTGFDHPEAIAFLQNEADINRLEVTTDIWHLWQPDTALLNGLYDVWGVYNPLTLARITRFWQGAYPRSSSSYNLLGLKYVVASKAGAPADGDMVPIFDADPQVNIYLNRAALPRILFVPQATYVDNPEAAWEAVKSPAFNPLEMVVLENVPASQRRDSPNMPSANANLGIALLTYNLHTVEVGLTTAMPGYLVLSDTYYPGWQATVDGEVAPLYQANYAFRAVPVPAGVHTVKMVFQPRSWPIGLGVSGMTVLILWISWGFRREVPGGVRTWGRHKARPYQSTTLDMVEPK